jgi:hypothetical protein
MKSLLCILFACAAPACFAQEPESAVQVHLATFVGTGISGRAAEMSNGALMANFSIPIQFRKQWYVIPEVYGGAFRSPRYPNKVGYFFESYPRIRHEAKGVRLGKGFKTQFPRFIFQVSVGAELLWIYEPCCYKISKFSESYGEKLYRTYAIPAQLDARFQLNKKGSAFLIFNARGDFNGHRSFGSLNMGIDFRLLPIGLNQRKHPAELKVLPRSLSTHLNQ